MRFINRLVKAIRQAADCNSDVQAAPVCIVWPDSDRQWEAVIPRLQSEMPELLILGEYAPEQRVGPAIWLRCVLAKTVEDVEIPQKLAPIIYLPGVSRQDLRAVESCPEHLKPLAELQYRGVIWSQINAKDWTILAFLKSDQGGLGLDVAMDNGTKNAMQLALYRLLDEEIDLLEGKRLDKDYFNTLLTGGDPVRDLLLWLDQGDAFRETRSEHEWIGFVEVCKSQLALDPQNDGILEGAARLAAHEGPWKPVWDRYCEAPKRYPSIPETIRQCSPPNHTLFWEMSDGSFDGWPQWNEYQEQKLQRELVALRDTPAHVARAELQELEKQHGFRRSLVWAELGETPLAQALEHLALLAERTQTGLAAGNLDDIEVGYQNHGWEADNAVLDALCLVDKTSDVEAVTVAIRAVYFPWLEESARYLQKIVEGASYPGGTITSRRLPDYEESECVLFVDGLRFDTAKRLKNLLQSSNLEVSEKTVWTALPSVTATGKAAVSPVQMQISGEMGTADFEPCVAETGQSLKGGYHLKKLLKDNHWKILERSDCGDGQGNAWCEFGDIDHEGHDRGWKLAKHVDTLLSEVREQILVLLDHGWNKVRIVTDHGWLLVPGSLPKIDMPSVLAETKWGRCAAIKPGATTEERLYPWFWNSNQYFALADGVSCFRKGEDYAHGGLSLQECLTLELLVTSQVLSGSNVSVEITDVLWKGFRCTAAVDGDFANLTLDIRTQPGNPTSSVVLSSKGFKQNGTASVVVEDEDLEGQPVILVLLDANGRLVSQLSTVVGGAEV